MNIIQRRISSTAHNSVSSNTDRRAMIQDTSSEASEDIEPAPYFRKVKFFFMRRIILIIFYEFRNQMTKVQGEFQ